MSSRVSYVAYRVSRVEKVRVALRRDRNAEHT